MIVYALVLGSAVCLGCAVFTDWDFLSYAAFGLAVIGLALFVWQALRARKAARQADSGDDPSGLDESEESEEPEESATAGESEKDSPETTEGAGVSEEDAPAVYVVPGRKRFHSGECRTLEGVSSQELTPVEAEEEGFTPCTLCRPAQRTEGVLS